MSDYRYPIKEIGDLESKFSLHFPTCDAPKVTKMIYEHLGENKPSSAHFFISNDGLEIFLHRNGYSKLCGWFALKNDDKGSLSLFKNEEYKWEKIDQINPRKG